jgi:hypothetical protein
MNPQQLRHAFRVHKNAFGSIQIDPVDVLAIEHLTQSATVALGAGWRPREVPFAELASTPARAVALALAILLPTASAEKSAPLQMAGAGAAGSF